MRIKPRPCVICGKVFQPKMLLVKKQPTCGCKECVNAWRRRKYQEARDDPDVLTCEYCGKEFTPTWKDRQVTCGAQQCQAARKTEAQLERMARVSEEKYKAAVANLNRLRTRRLYDRKRREARA